MRNETVQIEAPKFEEAIFNIHGTAPLVMNKFSQKAREQLRATHAAGSQGKKGKKREAKDFDQCYEGAIHRSMEGWIGWPASAFRAAMVSACRIVGFQMTRAKLALFIQHDGIDADEGTPLVKIEGKPRPMETIVTVGMGKPDVRIRPMFDKWSIVVRVLFDADIFSRTDVANLLMRAGIQVGIGEGRPDSRQSVGMGWGTFAIENSKDKK